MYKKIIALICMIIILVSCCSCNRIDNSRKNEKEIYSKYETSFIGSFDTFSTIVGYAKTQEEFTIYANMIRERMDELDKYFDIYNNYEGINNLKTVNDNAGIAPVEVDFEIIKFMKEAKQAYYHTDGMLNIAFGSVLRVWHEYRTEGIDDPDHAALPPFELLEERNKNVDIENLIIDEEASTLYLKNIGMSVDVGALAKGYSAQVAVDEAVEAGMNSAVVSIGGNILSVGKPLDGERERWGIGIQNPKLNIEGTDNILDVVFVNDVAVVSSGNYERYYVVDGKEYNHIIDPDTLMPAVRYDEVTIIHEDSYIAEMLSTALYILPFEEGKALAEKYDAEVIWVYPDESVKATDGYQKISKNMSGYSAIDK